MEKLVLYGIFSISALAIIISLIFSLRQRQVKTSSKKISDAHKAVLKETRSDYKLALKNYSMVAVVLLVAILYALGWQSAAVFLAAAVIFPLLDYYQTNLAVNSGARAVELSRSGQKTVFRSIYSASVFRSILITAVAIVFGLGIQYLFSTTATLLSLVLALIITSIFWPRGKSKYALLVVATISLSFAVFGSYLQNAANYKLFAAGISATTIVFAALSAVLTSVLAKKFIKSSAIFYGLCLFTLFLLVVFYYSVQKHFFGVSYNLILVSASLAIGYVFSILNLTFHKVNKIIPAISVGLLLLASNYFFGTVGMVFLLVGFSASAVIAAIFASYSGIMKNAETIALTAELSEAPSVLTAERVPEIRTGSFVATLVSLLALGFLTYFVAQMKKYSLDLGNQKIIAGLILGGTLTYLSNLEVFKNNLLKVSAVVLIVLVTGVTLGPVYLAGALAGAILVNLLTRTADEEVFLAVVLSVLASALIENPYNITVRAIIAGIVLVLIAIYLVLNKFYGRKTV
ncbi:MAG: hypothetical protein WC451_00725 [Patescibacteria group bacterium]